jgi:isopentenyl phosphate kinase
MATPAVKETLYLLYLDRYHLGDEIFINNLAQRMHRAPAGDPLCLIVHGSGEKVERTLESQGFFPERTGGVLDVTEPEQVRLVERAVRETNQKLVATLTDEVVPAVGIQGIDRNLLQLEAGTVTAPKVGWVEALLKQRVVPVVSALVHHPEEDRVREVAAAEALVALAQSFDALDPVAVFFATGTQPGLADATGVRNTVDLDALPDDGPLPDPEAVRHIVQEDLPGLITTLEGLFAEDAPSGTRVQP